MANDDQKNLGVEVNTPSTLAVKPALTVGLVVYGDQYIRQSQAMAWAEKQGWELAAVVNNAPGAAQLGQIQGSNACFEFSGYQEVLERLTGPGPFLLINDTFFYNHATLLWCKLLHQLNKQLRHVSNKEAWILGDIRREEECFPEKNNIFLASWLFYIPNRASLDLLAAALTQLTTESLPEPGEGYQSYVNRWLLARGPWGGWHGKRTEASLARKRRVIRLEHRLSQLLEQGGWMRGADEFVLWYPLLRICDRIKTRFLAVMSKGAKA